MMRRTRINLEDINTYIEQQLLLWPLAKKNYDELAGARRKPLPIGDFMAFAQFNPARIVSTGAKVDPKSIKERKCFLCGANRPQEQMGGEWLPGWEFLVNPFPILPVHFTIPAIKHIPQAAIPLELASMAENAPDLMFFYNGAKAGASAPDHLHCQAVLKSEVPLVHLVERSHTTGLPDLLSSDKLGLALPFRFFSALIKPDQDGMYNLARITSIKGIDNEGNEDSDLVNAYAWIDTKGFLRMVVIPRSAHRPRCYYEEGGKGMMISPGALDMAGLVILPMEKDFEKITPEDLREIYSQVALPN